MHREIVKTLLLEAQVGYHRIPPKGLSLYPAIAEETNLRYQGKNLRREYLCTILSNVWRLSPTDYVSSQNQNFKLIVYKGDYPSIQYKKL